MWFIVVIGVSNVINDRKVGTPRVGGLYRALIGLHVWTVSVSSCEKEEEVVSCPECDMTTIGALVLKFTAT
jgi:hypothetical protein